MNSPVFHSTVCIPRFSGILLPDSSEDDDLTLWTESAILLTVVDVWRNFLARDLQETVSSFGENLTGGKSPKGLVFFPDATYALRSKSTNDFGRIRLERVRSQTAIFREVDKQHYYSSRLLSIRKKIVSITTHHCHKNRQAQKRQGGGGELLEIRYHHVC
mmetsp:Transcript_34696/g.39305  ORF Transcript_34696/g.39305 Transcript_34696/m.39305 type:complete len:160 (-) Transcript_34696:25-504(-)